MDRRGESRSPVGPREARGIRPPSRGLLPPSLGLLREGGTDPLRSSPYRRSVRGHVRIVLPTSEKGGHSFPSFPPERGALPSLSSVRIQERGAFLVFVPPKRGGHWRCSSVRIQERGAFLVFVPPKRGALAVLVVPWHPRKGGIPRLRSPQKGGIGGSHGSARNEGRFARLVVHERRRRRLVFDHLRTFVGEQDRTRGRGGLHTDARVAWTRRRRRPLSWCHRCRTTRCEWRNTRVQREGSEDGKVVEEERERPGPRTDDACDDGKTKRGDGRKRREEPIHQTRRTRTACGSNENEQQLAKCVDAACRKKRERERRRIRSKRRLQNHGV